MTARQAQVEMKADTFVYNAGAYRVPEGSALEELVKKLPGAEVAEDGTITINGKEVKKIMIDGKDNQIMLECKGDETLTFVPLRGNDKEMQYTVQELKDYCNKHGLTIHAVPYLKFSD